VDVFAAVYAKQLNRSRRRSGSWLMWAQGKMY